MIPTPDSASPSPAPWVVHCDGSAMPNPGRMGLGVVICAPDGALHTFSQATHAIGCNNEAELRALLLALQELQARGARALRVHSDSSILVEHLGGVARAGLRPIARLQALFGQVRSLLQTFGPVELVWIPRHRNGEADALARAALGFGAKPPTVASRRRRRR